MKRLRLIFCILALSVFFTGQFFNPQPSFSATIDPSFTFSTIETEHFVIHFHQGLDGIAARAASISEDIHSKLTAELQWTPSEKTQIVLLDNIDFANGMATVLPYNAIYVFVVPPLHETTLGEYEDWLELVLLHEYTHILTMDPARGYSSVTRKIFGKTLPGNDPLSVLAFLLTTPPNVFMPKWWLEGIATWAETEFTSAGRGRSTFVEMILRMSVLEDSVPRVDQLNGDVPYWPSGRIPYIYGMLLERYIAEKYGKEALGKLNIRHAGRVPFFINAPPKVLTGLNYAELYNDMVNALETEQYKKIQKLRTRPLTDYKKVRVEGEFLTNPRVSPNGIYLAINRRDPHYHEEIIIVDKSSFREITSIRRLPSDRSLSWAPDSQKLYFTQADLNGSFNLYQDIYVYNFAGGTLSRITKNLRAKDIDVSPDGEQIAFVKIEAGRQNIALLSLKDSSVKVVTEMDSTALSGPKWSPDGRYIVFTRHDVSGQTSIELLDTESKTTETLLKDEYYNIHPVWSPDEKTILFASNRTGVYNLFAYSLIEKRIYQITHVMGGAFQPEVSWEDRKIFFSGYNSKGFFIAEFPYDTAAWTREIGPQIQTSWNDSDPGEPVSDIDKDQSSVIVSEKKKYCPSKTLIPKFWIPTLMFDHDGPVFGALTAGQDVIGYHTYLLQGGIGTSKKGYFNISYIYDRWEPTFFLRAYSLPVFYSDFFDDEDNYFERRNSVIAGVRIPLPLSTLESRYSLIAGYNYIKLSSLSDIDNRTVDGLEVYEGRRDNIFAGFLYSGTLKYPYSISREEGRNISLIYRDYSKSLGSGLSQEEYALDYEEFMRVRPGKNDALYLHIKGAASDGEQIAQQAYQIGGIPSPASEYPLRGFSSGFQTGKYVLTGTVEYRFPIKYFFRGWNTKPIFFDRLHLAVFTDAGNVWGNNKGFRLRDFSVGAGVEARMDIVLGYKLKITPAVGIAHGVTDEGETQAYITIYTEL